MLISNLRHFLTDTGDIPDDLPRSAYNILTRLGEIVAQISRSVPQGDVTKEMGMNIRCTRRPGHKACPGYRASACGRSG